MSVGRRATVVALLLTIWALAAMDGNRLPQNARWDQRLRPVTLYFGESDAMGVSPEIRWLQPEDMNPRELVHALLEGPRSQELMRTIPSSARLLDARRVGNEVILNFSYDIVRDHPGGSAGELITVYSVVNTLTELPGVERVAWLIEGEVVETLAGHLDLSRPIDRRDDMIVVPR